MVAQKNAKKDDPTQEDIYRVGTIGIIIQLLRLPDGTVKVLVEGKTRVPSRNILQNEDFFLVKVNEIEDIDDQNDVKKQA